MDTFEPHNMYCRARYIYHPSSVSSRSCLPAESSSLPALKSSMPSVDSAPWSPSELRKPVVTGAAAVAVAGADAAAEAAAASRLALTSLAR